MHNINGLPDPRIAPDADANKGKGKGYTAISASEGS